MFSGVQVTKNQDSGLRGLKGVAKAVVGGAVVLTGIKIIAGQNGLFVVMPQREVEFGGERRYWDIFYPLNDAIRKELEAKVLAEYLKEA